MYRHLRRGLLCSYPHSPDHKHLKYVVHDYLISGAVIRSGVERTNCKVCEALRRF
jgi:hypothetical protein